MNHQHQQPFMMPMPMLSPYQPPQEWHGNEVPARVQVAMELIRHLNAKTAKRGWGFDSMVIEIDGEPLQLCEQEAQAAACNMLIRYFKGELQPTGWEQYQFTAQGQGQAKIALVDCPLCKNDAKKNAKCQHCNGHGKVLYQGTVQ